MKIIAHRGNDNIHKENSLEAILNSLKCPYIDGVEIDIRLTKDNKLILSHDPFNQGYYINHTNSVTLQKQGLNTLEEILKEIKTDKIIMIDVKVDHKNIKRMQKALLNIVKKYPLNYYICSFNYEFISQLKKNYYKKGLIISQNINNKYINNNFDFNSINYLYNKKLPSKETFKWTINTKKELQTLNKQDNIITDKAKDIYNFIQES